MQSGTNKEFIIFENDYDIGKKKQTGVYSHEYYGRGVVL
jgi:hypothetical protein